MSHPFDQDRRSQRVPVHVPVRVSTIDPETDPLTGQPYFRDTREYVANISEGGAFIRTNDPPQAGGRVLVQIHVAEGESIEAVGRVAWSRRVLTPATEAPDVDEAEDEAGAGVEFLEDHESWERLQGALRHQD